MNMEMELKYYSGQDKEEFYKNLIRKINSWDLELNDGRDSLKIGDLVSFCCDEDAERIMNEQEREYQRTNAAYCFPSIEEAKYVFSMQEQLNQCTRIRK